MFVDPAGKADGNLIEPIALVIFTDKGLIFWSAFGFGYILHQCGTLAVEPELFATCQLALGVTRPACGQLCALLCAVGGKFGTQGLLNGFAPLARFHGGFGVGLQ